MSLTRTTGTLHPQLSALYFQTQAEINSASHDFADASNTS